MRMKLTLTGLILLTLFSCQEPQEKQKCKNSEVGFVQIFDGKTFNNWIYDSVYWRIEDGVLIGEVTPETILDMNSFIIWQGGQPSDFELKLEYRVSKDGNSGINYRSVHYEHYKYALRGYQCDIDGNNKYTGMNYEEKGRRTLARHGEKVIVHTQPNSEEEGSFEANVSKNTWLSSEVVGSLGDIDSLNANIKSNDWNEVHLIVKGNRMLHYINNTLMCDVTDNDTLNRTFSGYIGVQVHIGPPMKIEYKNIRIKEL